MQLKTLEEFNAERQRAIAERQSLERPNGIACPACGAELVDDTGLEPEALFVVLSSYPAQLPVRCPSCTFTGSRIA